MRAFEPTSEQVTEYDRWVSERPEHMRDICAKFKPWDLYELNTGQLVYVVAFDEHADGPPTLKVNVDSQYNPFLVMERTVFGVKPEDLKEPTC